MSWLDQQRMKLRMKRMDSRGHSREVERGAWVDSAAPIVGVKPQQQQPQQVPQQQRGLVNRTKQECQLIAELKNAQDSILKRHTSLGSPLSDESPEMPPPLPSVGRRRLKSVDVLGSSERRVGAERVPHKGDISYDASGNSIVTEHVTQMKCKALPAESYVASNTPVVKQNGNSSGGEFQNGEGLTGQCKTEKNYFVSGIEQPPFTTHQTRYFFSMSTPQTMGAKRGEAVPEGRPSSTRKVENVGGVKSTPVTPQRGQSSHEAMKQSMSYDWGLAARQNDSRGGTVLTFIY